MTDGMDDIELLKKIDLVIEAQEEPRFAYIKFKSLRGSESDMVYLYAYGHWSNSSGAGVDKVAGGFGLTPAKARVARAYLNKMGISYQ